MNTPLNIKHLISGLIFSTASLSSIAQTGVGNEEVIIIKEHDARIKDATKINVSPTLPNIEEKAPNLDYRIPTKDFKEIAVEASPMRPIALPKEKLERFNNSYIKLGFGSQLSPLAELVYNGKGKNIKYGVDFSHFNALPFDIKNQRFFDDKVGAYIKAYPATFLVGADFRFQNRITHFYGNQKTETQSRKQIKQTFQDFDANVFFGSHKKNDLGIDFLTRVRFDYFRELAGKSNEYFVNGLIKMGKQITPIHAVSGSFEYDGSNYITTSQKLWRNYFLLGLKYNLTYKDLVGHAGITLAVEGEKAYALPDIYLQKGLYEKYLTAYVGWKIGYQKNTFRNFALENNFINAQIELQNARTSDLFGGLKGAISDFSYNAMFSFKNVANQAFYYNDYFDSKRFYIAYDPKMRVLNGKLELGYNFTNSLSAFVAFDYNHYKLSTNAKAWYRPDFKADVKLRYNIKEKFIVGAELYAFTAYFGHVNTSEIRKMKGTADANISVEYIFNKRFSFFGYLNNIAHQRYQRWADYPVFGVNGLVGAKFSF
jgi:hypothetical protein